MIFLEHVPFLKTPHEFPAHDGNLAVGAFQLVVFACLKPNGEGPPTLDDRVFPVVIDSGFTGNLSIWTRHRKYIRREYFEQFPTIRRCIATFADGRTKGGNRLNADLWIKSNIPKQAAVLIPLNGGFDYFEEDNERRGNEIPLLGAQALNSAGTPP